MNPLLVTADTWGKSRFTDTTAGATLDVLLGVPIGPPPAPGGTYQRSPGQLDWHFHLKFDNHEVS